jgi:hypothetical protein
MGVIFASALGINASTFAINACAFITLKPAFVAYAKGSSLKNEAKSSHNNVKLNCLLVLL